MLREAVEWVRQRHPFFIDAWVLLPDHMHCIWTLPEQDTDFSKRWSLIKSNFSKRAKAMLHNPEWMNVSKLKHRESTIWQRRFWEHLIRDDEDYRIHMDYIHYNPVRHGLVNRVRDWPYSTFHRYVRKGIYSENWGGGMIPGLDHDIGE
ncbi:MAG: transposase [Desulfobacterales bacterium]|nr:transposase [Desulfobacterales bacterium]